MNGPQRKQHRNWLAFIGTIVVMLYYIVDLYRSSETSLVDSKRAAVVLIVLCFLPMLWFIRSERKAFPVFALNTLYYAIGYASGPFKRAPAYFSAEQTDPLLLSATLLCILGVACQIVGYWSASVFRKPQPQLPQASAEKNRWTQLTSLDKGQVRRVGWSMLAISVLPLALAGLNDIPSLSQLFGLFRLAALAVLWYLFIRKSLPSSEAIVLAIVIIPVCVIDGLITGLHSNGLQIILLLMLVSCAAKHFLTAGVLGAALLSIASLLGPSKVEFRGAVWHGNREYSWTERLALMVELASRDLFASKTNSGEQPLVNGFMDRANQLQTLVRVMRYTPAFVPCWNGGSLTAMPSSLIPRIIWPNKPTQTIGQEFGHRYDLLDPMDRTTSANLPWIVELYANFTTLGVCAGMFIIGYLFQVIETRALQLQDNSFSGVFAIGLFSRLIFPEINLSLSWGGIFVGWIALLFVTSFASKIVPPATRGTKIKSV